jgi:hypothetical protein
MPEEIECPKHQAWLFLHCAKEGACEICLQLDGWFYFQGNHDDPYPISQHDKCRCYWNDYLIEGLYRFQREEMLNQHQELRDGYEKAVADIAFREYDIAELTITLDSQKEDKETQDQAAETFQNSADRLIAEAQEIIDSNDELTPEQQDYVDELLLLASDELSKAEDAIAQADALQKEIFVTERLIQNQEDLKDAAVYQKNEYDQKLKEVEPCLSLRCIEDEAEAMAGTRLVMNF